MIAIRFTARFVLAVAVVGGIVDPGGPAAVQAAKAKFNRVLSIGDAAPEWSELPGVDGQPHTLADYSDAPVVVVVFTCNHCPIAKAYEQRLLDYANKSADRKVQVVAINVNRSAVDGLEKMKVRAKEKQYPFPYLYDDSQQSGRAYGATVTPHFFVLDADRKIAYMGAFDDNANPMKVEKQYVADAVDAVLAGKAPPVKEALQRGCEINYE
ncbi:MAG: thioredoxin family protein [Planctomycetaceae bacterium]|nr:thioredoxin family protein [Planctomycetaceae bacterium]